MFNRNLEELAKQVEEDIKPVYNELDRISLLNHAKVLDAFHKTRVSEYHLKGSTGYGYGDPGREAVEKVFASVFRAEAALVRGQISCGTHAISVCLFGILRPGDELLFVTGQPYDTLQEVIGVRGSASGSLREWGITYQQVNLLGDGGVDEDGIIKSLNNRTKVVMIQRSRGYDWRPAVGIKEIEKICKLVRSVREDIVVLVDNCYGEFVEEKEPIEAGADLAAGSLTKNPGGGIVPTGGYIVGKNHLVEMVANRMTAPGLGGNVGASLEFNRWFLQGLFLAPHVVSEALKGSVFTAGLFERLGYEVSPRHEEQRSDIIQAVRLKSEEEMVAFCRGLQKGSPLDGHVIPEPVNIPGYEDKIVMAGGTFVAGSTIELSADGPVREPFAVYMQGGLSKEYVKLGIMSAAKECLSAGAKKV